MPSWYWEQLGVLLRLAIPVLLVCVICGVIGSVGYFFRRGILCAEVRRWWSAWIMWIYSLLIGSLTFFALYKLQLDWKAWLTALAVIVMGFFGYFFVPGNNTLDSSDQHHH
ncbi:MAG: hypothetical protein ABI413_04435 [Ktedonobacteraceae bacterium]